MEEVAVALMAKAGSQGLPYHEVEEVQIGSVGCSRIDGEVGLPDGSVAVGDHKADDRTNGGHGRGGHKVGDRKADGGGGHRRTGDLYRSDRVVCDSRPRCYYNPIYQVNYVQIY